MAYPGLVLRKLADRSEGERVERYDPVSGEKSLINPETNMAEPWPFAGIRIEGDPPQLAQLTPSRVAEGKAEGWLEVEGEQDPVFRRAGPIEEPYRVPPHVFIHADAFVLHTVDGDVRYDVVHQPDKYAADGDDNTPVTDEMYAAGETRVDHFYGLELAEGS